MVKDSAFQPFRSSSGTDRLLGLQCAPERVEADAAQCVDEFLMLALAQREIDIDDPLDRIGNLVAVDAGAKPLAERGEVAGVAAERDLVILHAGLIEPEDSDMADMMVAAGVDAARNLDAEP